MIVGALTTVAALVGGFFIARSMQTSDEDKPSTTIVAPIVAPDPPTKLPATKPPDPPPVKLIDPGTLVVKLKRGTTGVNLVVDGKPQPGRGPWELSIEPGEHQVTLAGPRVKDAPVQTVTIESGKPTSIELGISPTVIKRWTPNTNTIKPTGSSQDDFIAPAKKP